MKRALLALLLLATTAAEEASLSGKWKVKRSANGNDSEQECSITQKDGTLSGTCVSAGREPVKISGKVDGKSVTWTYKGDSPGGMVTVVYKGTLESANKISGTVTAVEFNVEGEFSATRGN